MTGFTPEELRTAARVARRSIFTEGRPDLADVWDKAADQAEARLIPAGGMALTAEQVEDVRTVVSADAAAWNRLSPALFAAYRLRRALFPATEPAEDAKPCGSNSVTLGWCKLTARHEGLHTNGTYLWGTPSEPDPPAPSEPAEERCQSVSIFRERCALVPGHDGRHAANGCAWGYPLAPAEPAEGVKPVKFRKMTAKYATANFGFPDVTDPFTRWAYKDSDGDKWAWNGDQWELHIVPPSPAEPAEGVKPVKFRKMTAKYATANFGFPDVTDPFTRWAYKDSDGDKWAWNGDQWELHIVPPSPAEPAEEETKAEHNAAVARREALGRVAQQLYEQSFDGCDGTFYHDFGRALEDFLPSQGWTRIPVSSPVVHAPTETGPWQTWEAVPRGQTVRAANGERFRKNGVGAIHLLTNGVGDCCQVDTEANPLPAPFFAVTEES